MIAESLPLTKFGENAKGVSRSHKITLASFTNGYYELRLNYEMSKSQKKIRPRCADVQCDKKRSSVA